MLRSFFVFSNGRFQRKQNTLFFINDKDQKRALPVETVDDIYVFSEMDFNTKFINFLAQNQIQVHFFNYYGFYAGSFIPRESLLSGKVVVEQVKSSWLWQKI